MILNNFARSPISAVFLFSVLLGGCASPARRVALHRTAGYTMEEKTWDAMEKSARKSAGKHCETPPCSPLTQSPPLTAQVVDMRANSGYIDLELSVSETAYGSRHVTCGLDAKKHRAAAARLSPGDTVTVRGVLSIAFESVYFTDIVLRPCELVPPERPRVSNVDRSPTKS